MGYASEKRAEWADSRWRWANFPGRWASDRLTLDVASSFMQPRNPFEPPGAEFALRSGLPYSRFALAVGVLVFAWMITFPLLWWSMYIATFGFQPSAVHMVQSVSLAGTSLLVAPFILRKISKAAITLFVISILIALSIWIYPSAFPGGDAVNACLAAVVGAVSWLRSRKASTQSATSNPSIERTLPSKPVSASHVER